MYCDITTLFAADEAYLWGHLSGFDRHWHQWSIISGPEPRLGPPCSCAYEVLYGVCNGWSRLATLRMSWVEINGYISPHLEAFDDAIVLLGSPLHISLIEGLSHIKDFTPDQFIAALRYFRINRLR